MVTQEQGPEWPGDQHGAEHVAAPSTSAPTASESESGPDLEPGRWTGGTRSASARVNRSARIRGDNLAAILELVHHRGGISRAQLTRETGLNRSTVSALVADLVGRSLVFEAYPTIRGDVGRPSPVVHASPTTVAIAVNPEIDGVTVAIIALGGSVVAQETETFTQPPSATSAVASATRIIARLLAASGENLNIVGVGVAVPGLVEASKGVVRVAPHLGWYDEPISEMLAQSTGFPTYAANDAGIGAHAERVFGAGRGVSDMVYLNGGASGIGGGIIAGGIALRGRAGFAGEIGHTYVIESEKEDPSRARGSLEVMVNRDALLRTLGRTGLDADELQRQLVASTDASVREEIEVQLQYLAIAIGNVVNLLNPEVIVLGGFLAALHTAAPGRLEKLVESRALSASTTLLRIVSAQLGSSLLLIGAAELAFAELLADPTRVKTIAQRE